MRSHSAGVLVAIASCFACPGTGAHAQSNDIPCDAFVKNSDDTWSALRNVAIQGTGDSLTIRQGSVLRPGAVIKGIDLATMLDQQCPATPEPAPASVQPPAPLPRVTLGSFANANGTIETQRLSCGELADASPEEAGLFLAWYSGWYNGSAKKRGINLVRVRSSIHTVIDYCRGNRDKKIVNVMDLMLK
jgi:hypothetical protein